MPNLVSPGVSISVIDQSINIGSGPGTVPLIFITTQQDKLDPTSTSSIAEGTKKENAGKVYSITSQRELIATFGDPYFHSIGGTSINGYPLNEYGLLAAHSFLGIANLARVVRADVNTSELEPSTVEPSSPAEIGTYWLDETSTNFGLFKLNANNEWISYKPDYIFNGTTTPTTGSYAVGKVAVNFNNQTGYIAFYVCTAITPTLTWTQLTGGSGSTAPVANSIIMSATWPTWTTGTAGANAFWFKTGSAAQGANIVLRKMDATTNAFLQVEAPILSTDASANTYYSNNTVGKHYIQTASGSTPNQLLFRYSATVGTWAAFINEIIGSQTMPVSGPVVGQYWFNPLVGLNSDGTSTVDIMVKLGGSWVNCNLPGFNGSGEPAQLPAPTNSNPTVFPQSQDPASNTPTPILKTNDVWVKTDASPYPVIYKRSSGGKWVLVDLKDQTTPNGIIFNDARPNPAYVGAVSPGGPNGENNGGGANPDLDPDAPNPALYPTGFLLWNTRYSTNNVKQWHSDYTFEGTPAGPYNGSTGRWVTFSGNDQGGVPYCGQAAQKISLVKAVQAVIVDNEQIRAEDIYFNLISAPNYVEAIDEMLVLNDDRKGTAFIVGDTPFTLSPSGTALQAWATNANLAYGNGDKGLTSGSKYFGVWYPSGLSTNLDGTDVVVPPSHMALRTIAYNDQVAYPWFAPAGLQRGVVNNAASVGYVNTSGQYIPIKLSEGQRDVLYVNGVNPIRTMPTGNIVVFGQKTKQPYASATDRINVVRLECFLRYQLNLLAQPFLFEPNDTITRKSVTAAFNRVLQELVTLRGLYDFLVVCDTSNNTPARIDANQLWVDIAIQPAKAIEFIYIPIRIQNTGGAV